MSKRFSGLLGRKYYIIRVRFSVRHPASLIPPDYPSTAKLAVEERHPSVENAFPPWSPRKDMESAMVPGEVVVAVGVGVGGNLLYSNGL